MKMEFDGLENSTASDVRQPLALGGVTKGVTTLQIAAAYAAIANDGTYLSPVLYTKVLDQDGNVLLDNTPGRDSCIQGEYCISAHQCHGRRCKIRYRKALPAGQHVCRRKDRYYNFRQRFDVRRFYPLIIPVQYGPVTITISPSPRMRRTFTRYYGKVL